MERSRTSLLLIRKLFQPLRLPMAHEALVNRSITIEYPFPARRGPAESRSHEELAEIVYVRMREDALESIELGDVRAVALEDARERAMPILIELGAERSAALLKLVARSLEGRP